MSANNLNKTRTYLVGHMQYVTDKVGESWRDRITPRLNKMGIVVYNPYHKPFVKDVQEGPAVSIKLNEAKEKGDFEFLATKMREIRSFDLNLVDRSDFIIAHIIPTVASWGSAEEIVTANRMKKPIFLSVEGGKKNCPFWLFGMIPYKYIYNSPDEIVDMLEKIDNGSKPIDSDRWRLLRMEFR